MSSVPGGGLLLRLIPFDPHSREVLEVFGVFDPAEMGLEGFTIKNPEKIVHWLPSRRAELVLNGRESLINIPDHPSSRIGSTGRAEGRRWLDSFILKCVEELTNSKGKKIEVKLENLFFYTFIRVQMGKGFHLLEVPNSWDAMTHMRFTHYLIKYLTV